MRSSLSRPLAPLFLAFALTPGVQAKDTASAPSPQMSAFTEAVSGDYKDDNAWWITLGTGAVGLGALALCGIGRGSSRRRDEDSPLPSQSFK